MAGYAVWMLMLSLGPGDRRHESLLQQVDLADIAAACRARLGEGLTEAGSLG